MRRLPLAAIIVGTLLGFASSSQAQLFPNNNGYDPFSLYYGWYLPSQAALSVRNSNGPQATINALSAARQEAAYTDRATLYDPMAKYGLDYKYDPNRPFPDRMQGTRPGGLAAAGSNINGSGPQPYFNRAGQYFPGQREGRGPNANSFSMGGRSRGGGFNPMGGMPNFGGGGFR